VRLFEKIKDGVNGSGNIIKGTLQKSEGVVKGAAMVLKQKG
jgi:hypothetical protein